MIWRVVEQVNRFAYLVNQLYHPFEKLCANTATFWTIIYFELDALSLLLLVRCEVVPPLKQCIHLKIAGFAGATKDQVHLSVILIHDAKREYTFHPSQNHGH